MATATQLDAGELRTRIERFHDAHRRIVGEVRKVIVGQQEVLEQVMIALFVGGHCLITGLPGTAKTFFSHCICNIPWKLVSRLASSVSLRRVRKVSRACGDRRVSRSSAFQQLA